MDLFYGYCFGFSSLKHHRTRDNYCKVRIMLSFNFEIITPMAILKSQ